MSGVNHSIVIFLEFVKFTGITAFFNSFSFLILCLLLGCGLVFFGKSLRCVPRSWLPWAPAGRRRTAGTQTGRSQLGSLSGGAGRGASPGTAAALGRLGVSHPKADRRVFSVYRRRVSGRPCRLPSCLPWVRGATPHATHSFRWGLRARGWVPPLKSSREELRCRRGDQGGVGTGQCRHLSLDLGGGRQDAECGLWVVESHFNKGWETAHPIGPRAPGPQEPPVW